MVGRIAWGIAALVLVALVGAFVWLVGYLDGLTDKELGTWVAAGTIFAAASTAAAAVFTALAAFAAQSAASQGAQASMMAKLSLALPIRPTIWIGIGRDLDHPSDGAWQLYVHQNGADQVVAHDVQVAFEGAVRYTESIDALVEDFDTIPLRIDASVHAAMIHEQLPKFTVTYTDGTTGVYWCFTVTVTRFVRGLHDDDGANVGEIGYIRGERPDLERSPVTTVR